MQARHGKDLQGLIFDLDDTLYLQSDYKRSGFKAVADWLAEHYQLDPERTISVLEDILKEKGPSYPNMFDDFVVRRSLQPGLARKLVAVFIDHRPQITCFPGVHDMLDRLRGRYRLGLLTDGRESSQKKKVAALQLRNRMDAILYSADMKSNKPATCLYRWFEERFALPGAQLAYIGDNPLKDFRGANQCRWLTIRVLTGEHGCRQVEPRYDAAVSLPRATDLIDWLASRNII